MERSCCRLFVRAVKSEICNGANDSCGLVTSPQALPGVFTRLLLVRKGKLKVGDSVLCLLTRPATVTQGAVLTSRGFDIPVWLHSSRTSRLRWQRNAGSVIYVGSGVWTGGPTSIAGTREADAADERMEDESAEGNSSVCLLNPQNPLIKGG